MWPIKQPHSRDGEQENPPQAPPMRSVLSDSILAAAPCAFLWSFCAAPSLTSVSQCVLVLCAIIRQITIVHLLSEVTCKPEGMNTPRGVAFDLHVGP